MLDQIILLIVLLVLSGFFSSSETALFSISKTKARHLAKQDIKSLKLIRKMKEDPHKLLTTILIGNNIVNVGAAAMATSISITIFPNHAVGIATGAMTFLILVFGEVLPKSLATRNNILIARIIIYPIYWISILFYPVVKFIESGNRHRHPELRRPGALEGWGKMCAHGAQTRIGCRNKAAFLVGG